MKPSEGGRRVQVSVALRTLRPIQGDHGRAGRDHAEESRGSPSPQTRTWSNTMLCCWQGLAMPERALTWTLQREGLSKHEWTEAWVVRRKPRSSRCLFRTSSSVLRSSRFGFQVNERTVPGLRHGAHAYERRPRFGVRDVQPTLRVPSPT